MTDKKDDRPTEQLTKARRRLAGDLGASAFLVRVIEGVDKGRELLVDEGAASRVLVGQGPACELRLADPHVSRRHAALDVVSRQLRITDLDSRNRTYVDGVAIGEAYLRGGEVVRIGDTALRVEPQSAAAAPTLPAQARFGRTLGASPAMRRLYPLLARLAVADVPVILEGETGTGKEQLAESLHEESRRRDRPFVVLDCTAIAPNLIESELFGHEKGAFTGSVSVRKGVFERANGGTLLVDEIGELPLELQPKLLRAVERGTITRVGGERSLPVDVRLLAATRRDLDQEVQKGRFRDDLFHRLAVARVELPPLRARRGDVALLARHFWTNLGGAADALPGDLLLRWEDAPWPGNVRELRNAVARRLALGDLADVDSSIDVDVDIGAEAVAAEAHPFRAGSGDSIGRILALDLPLAEARERLLDEFGQRYVERLLKQYDNNVTRAASAAGIARRHLQRLKAK